MTEATGPIGVAAVMAELAGTRPVFHSEADFQFAFAEAVRALDPSTQVRLEVPLRDVEGLKGSQHLDLMLRGSASRTAVELKYSTRAWTGTDGMSDEEYSLRHHAATDLARRDFVFDVARLEQFCRAGLADSGVAIMLTNEPGLWTPSRRRSSNDREFHVHDAQVLAGTLRWANDLYPDNTRTLSGRYTVQWRDYRTLDGANGTFRWLAIEVAAPT